MKAEILNLHAEPSRPKRDLGFCRTSWINSGSKWWACAFSFIGGALFAQVEAPEFDPNESRNPVGYEVKVTCSTPGTTIHYTTNGVDPTASDAVIASGGDIFIPRTSVLKARAYDASSNASAVTAQTFWVTGIVTAGSTHSMGMRYDGKLYAWGSQLHGALGDGVSTATIQSSPVPTLWDSLHFVNAIDASAGSSHSLAIDTEANLWAWGLNSSGQLGNNTTVTSSEPVQVLKSSTPGDYLVDVVLGSAGTNFSLALTSNGQVWAWGANALGQLGDGTTTSRSYAGPVTESGSGTPHLDHVLEIDAGKDHSLALAEDGTIWGWGENAAGQLGDGSTTARTRAIKVQNLVSPSPLVVADFDGVTSVSAGMSHSALIRHSSGENGTVWSWGEQFNGALGNGQTSAGAVVYPEQVEKSGSIALDGIVQISAGVEMTLALDSNGQVWAWGNNSHGALGDGTTTNRAYADKVLAGASTELSNIQWISAGGATNGYSLAIDSSGRLYAWGYNGDGALGDGSTTDRLYATLVGPFFTDSDTDGLDDAWEALYFGDLDESGAGDPDGDASTTLEEFEGNSNPNDYYQRPSGAIDPTITIVSGNNQSGAPDAVAAQPLLVEVKNGSTPLVNAPVTFTVSPSGSGEISTVNTGTGRQSALTVTTDSNGRAQVYFYFPSSYGTNATVEVVPQGEEVTGMVAFGMATHLISQTGLRVWLKADDGITKDGADKVSAWSNLGSLGSSAAQATSTRQPLWVSSASNGKPIIRFNGSSTWLQTAAVDLFGGATEFSVFVVTKPGATQVAYADIFDYDHATNLGFPMQQNNTTTNQFAIGVGMVQLVANQFNIMSSVKSGTNQKIFLKGVETGSYTYSPFTTMNPPRVFTVGCKSNQTYSRFFNGDVAEIVVYNRALTSTERTQTEVYLADKYGLFHPNATWPLSYSSEVQTEITARKFTKAEADAYAAFLATEPPIPASGLTLWLKADAGVTADGSNVVSTWADQSIGGKNLTQATAANRPTIQANQLNGKPVIRFDGSNDCLSVVSSAWGSTQFSVGFLIKPNTTTDSNQRIYAGAVGGGWGQFYFHTSAAGSIYTGTNDTTRMTPGTGAGQIPNGTMKVNTWQHFTFTYDNGTAKFYKNGYLLATKSVASPTAWTGFALGMASNQTINGDLAELYVYSNALSASDVENATDYLTEKYDPQFDTDGDGMSDVYEVENGLNPLSHDLLGDNDGDGIPNQWEFANGSEAGNAASVNPDWIVDPAHGADSTLDNIVSTIAEAITAVPVDNGTVAASYKSILVKPGEYAEKVVIPDNKRIALVGEPNSSPVRLIGSAVNDYVLDVRGLSWVSGFWVTRPTAAIASGTVTQAGIYAFTNVAQLWIVNCLVSDHTMGISIGGGTNSVFVDHCTIFNNKTYGLYATYRDRERVQSSILWNPAVTAANEYGSPNSYGANTVSCIIRGGTHGGLGLDPKLSSTGLLLPTSAAINADIATSSLGGDIQGNARPQGSARDIGANEFFDSDEDGLPDWWEIQTFGDLNETGLYDLDSDGLTNAQEASIGTNPEVADTDGDGASDGAEVTSGSNPRMGDTDSDGVDDGYEVANGLNPLVDDRLYDKDGDGFPNQWEYAKGTAAGDVEDFEADWIVDPVNAAVSSSDNIVATIGEAISTVPVDTGDWGASYKTIWVKRGIYGEKVSIPNNKRIALIGEKSGVPVRLEGAALNDYAMTLAGRSVVDGFLITRPAVALANGAVNRTGINVAASGHEIRLSNSIITGHRGISSAAIEQTAGTVIVDHCTIFGNERTGSYGGKSGYISGSSTAMKVEGSILWNTSAGSEFYVYLGSVTVSASIIRGGEGGGLNSDPLLASNGTLTPSSPAINADTTTNFLGSDIHGDTRPSGGARDMGADEYVDNDADGLSDSWELENFGDLDEVASGDPDGDGLTNVQEFTGGGDPNNYFSRGPTPITPQIQIAGGDEQEGIRNAFLPVPLEVKVTNAADGSNLVNALVTFSVASGGGKVSLSDLGAPSLETILEVRTDAEGKAKAYYKQGTTGATESVIQAQVLPGVAVNFTATTFEAVPVINGGNQQFGLPDQYLTSPLTVKVTDGPDGPVLAGESINFSVTSGGARLASAFNGGTTVTSQSVTTDVNGLVQIFVKLGASALESNTITAAQSGIAPIAFTATALATDGRVAQWPLNEKAGIGADEVVTLSNDGTLTNGVQWSDGFDGKGAVSFSGASLEGGTNGHVTMGNPTNASLDFDRGSFSVASWVRFTESSLPPGETERRIVSKGNLAGESGYFLGVIADGKLVAGIGSDSDGSPANETVRIETVESFNDGLWHHVTLVFDAGENKVRILVDGVAQSLAAAAGTGGTLDIPEELRVSSLAHLNATSNEPFLMGSRNTSSGFFKGEVDDVRVYRKVLSETEAEAVFSADSDSNSLPDWWEYQYFGQLGNNATADPDSDGVANFTEYEEGSDPTNYYSQGATTLIPDVQMVSGDGQGGPPERFLENAFVVRIVNTQTDEPMVNAPVTFNVSSGGGKLATSKSGAPFLSSSRVVWTDFNGLAMIYFRRPFDSVTSLITATASSDFIEFTVSDDGRPFLEVFTPLE